MWPFLGRRYSFVVVVVVVFILYCLSHLVRSNYILTLFVKMHSASHRLAMKVCEGGKPL